MQKSLVTSQVQLVVKNAFGKHTSPCAVKASVKECLQGSPGRFNKYLSWTFILTGVCAT